MQQKRGILPSVGTDCRDAFSALTEIQRLDNSRPGATPPLGVRAHTQHTALPAARAALSGPPVVTEQERTLRALRSGATGFGDELGRTRSRGWPCSGLSGYIHRDGPSSRLGPGARAPPLVRNS
jgi:hypothetical protein